MSQTAEAVQTQPTAPPVPVVLPIPAPATGSPAAAATTQPAQTQPRAEAVWVDPQRVAYFAGEPGAVSEGQDAAGSSEPASAAAPPAQAAAQTQPPAAESSQPTAVLTESVVEQRVQAALTAARGRWDRDQAAAQERLVRDAAEQTVNQERAKQRVLWQKWKAEGDAEAGRELLDTYGATVLEPEITATTMAPHLEEARRTAQAQLWEQHAASFGVAPDDAEVRAATDFKSLNTALLRRAADEGAVAAAWENPHIQARHQRALEEAVRAAKEAAFNNGQATVLAGAQGPELVSAGGGRLPTAEEIARHYMNNPDDPAAQNAYREVRRQWGYR